MFLKLLKRNLNTVNLQFVNLCFCLNGCKGLYIHTVLQSWIMPHEMSTSFPSRKDISGTALSSGMCSS